MLEDASNEDEIPIPNVKSAILKKVIQFCEYTKANPTPEIEKPLKSSNMKDVVAPFYA